MAISSSAARAQWSAAFARHLARRKIKAAQAARELGCPVTSVHWWTRGSMPRALETRARIEAWSGGEVIADREVTP